MYCLNVFFVNVHLSSLLWVNYLDVYRPKWLQIFLKFETETQTLLSKPFEHLPGYWGQL